jgi:hypothetical protein
MPLSSIFKVCNLALPPRGMYRGLNLGLEMSTTDWLELAESRRQSAYERSRPPLRMPVSCRTGSLDVFFAHGKRSHASRVLEYVSMRMVLHMFFLLSDKPISQTSNVIIRDLYLESRQVDLGHPARRSKVGQQA